MIRKYHIHTLQTQGTERKSSHKTSGRQLKQSIQLSLTRQDDCKTRKDSKGMHITEQRQIYWCDRHGRSTRLHIPLDFSDTTSGIATNLSFLARPKSD